MSLYSHPPGSTSICSCGASVFGMQVFVTEAVGHGQIAFSGVGVGHIIALHASIRLSAPATGLMRLPTVALFQSST